LSWEGRERDNIGNPAQISSENYRRKVALGGGEGPAAVPGNVCQKTEHCTNSQVYPRILQEKLLG